MRYKLSEVDSQAIDLVLDHAPTAQNAGATFSSSQAHVSNEHVVAVEKVLHLLDAMPPANPPQDLLGRTLSRIERHTPAPLRPPTPAITDADQPMA